MKPLIIALCLALSGCAATPGCFAGIGLTGPVLICGFDLEFEQDEVEVPNV